MYSSLLTSILQVYFLLVNIQVLFGCHFLSESISAIFIQVIFVDPETRICSDPK